MFFFEIYKCFLQFTQLCVFLLIQSALYHLIRYPLYHFLPAVYTFEASLRIRPLANKRDSIIDSFASFDANINSLRKSIFVD